MLIDREGVHLRGGQTLYTLYARAAFRLVQGSVQVFLVEHSQEGMARRDARICRIDASSGRIIPAFVSMSAGDDLWCFAIEAGEDGAQLLSVPLEEGQLVRFLQASDIPPPLCELLEMRMPHILKELVHREGPAHDTLRIPEAASILADCPEASYCVESGAVNVFLMPVTESGMSERKAFLCRAEPGNGFAIPGLHYKAGGRLWQICLEAGGGDARILRMGCTRVAREKFLAAVQAQAGSTAEGSFLMDAYAHEGFEESLVQYYVHKTELADAIRESRQFRHKEDIRQRIQSTIHSGLGDKATPEPSGDAPVIRALRRLCKSGGIPLAEEALMRYRPGMPLHELAAACGLICRRIELEDNWFRKDHGLLLGRLGGHPVACIPQGRRGYRLYDPTSGREAVLDARIAGQIHPRAYAIGRALPVGGLRRRDVVLYVLRGVRKTDLLKTVLLRALCIPAALLLPLLVQGAFDAAIPTGNAAMLLKACLLACALMLSGTLFSLLARRQSLYICARAGRELQSAMFARVLVLPERMIARYESGVLAKHVQSFGGVAGKAADIAITLGISAACVPLYLLQVAHFAAALVPCAVLMAAAYGLLLFVLSVSALRHEKTASEKKRRGGLPASAVPGRYGEDPDGGRRGSCAACIHKAHRRAAAGVRLRRAYAGPA